MGPQNTYMGPRIHTYEGSAWPSALTLGPYPGWPYPPLYPGWPYTPLYPGGGSAAHNSQNRCSTWQGNATTCTSRKPMAPSAVQYTHAVQYMLIACSITVLVLPVVFAAISVGLGSGAARPAWRALCASPCHSRESHYNKTAECEACVHRSRVDRRNDPEIDYWRHCAAS